MHEQHAETAPQTTGRIIRWARWYDLVHGLLSFGRPSALYKRAIEIAAPRPGEKALDIGSGTGTMAIMIAQKVGPGGEVAGIDASPEMIEVARRKAKRQHSAARFELEAIEALSFSDGSFDLVTSSMMLHHLPADVQRKGLAQARRVLRPGGRLVIVDFSSESGSFLGHLLSLFGHKHGESTVGSLEAKLREAGFTQVEEVKTDRKGLMFVRAS